MTAPGERVDRIELSDGSIVVEDPLAVIAGYAFARDTPDSSPWKGPTYGELAGTKRARWAYATYDCVPAAAGPRLTGVDLVIAAGLNGDMNVGRVGALQAAAQNVGQMIDLMDEDTPFWQMDRGDIDEPTQGSPWWPLARAWYLLKRQPGVGVAITHKTLHHKRPRHFPLLDNKTLTMLAEDHAWSTIHDDLTGQSDSWEQLESQFAGLIYPGRGEVLLPRLRLHDILLWLRAPEIHQEDEARSAGEVVLADRT